jgi:nicotinamide N-methyltransferase
MWDVVEVVNSTLAPPTTCHSFTFTIPKQDTISRLGRTGHNPPTPSPGPSYDAQVYGRQSMLSTVDDSPQLPPQLQRITPDRTIRNSSSPTEIAYHGVTLTVWTHADPYRSGILKEIKARAQASKNPLDSLHSTPLPSTLGAKRSNANSMRGKRTLPWGLSRQQSETDMTASETEGGMSDSDMEGPLGRRAMRGVGLSVVDCLPEDAAAVFEDGGDVYWMPYAITMGKSNAWV